MIAQTLTLRVLSEEALLIIHQLARTHQLELLSDAVPVVKPDAEAELKPTSLPASRWRGIMSKERGEQMQKKVQEMRDEWEPGF